METFERDQFAHHNGKSAAVTRLQRTRTGTRSSHSHFHIPQHSALCNIGRRSPQPAHLLLSVCPQRDELFNIMLLRGWLHTAAPEPTNQRELWQSGTLTRHRWVQQQTAELVLITHKNLYYAKSSTNSRLLHVNWFKLCQYAKCCDAEKWRLWYWEAVTSLANSHVQKNQLSVVVWFNWIGRH